MDITFDTVNLRTTDLRPDLARRARFSMRRLAWLVPRARVWLTTIVAMRTLPQDSPRSVARLVALAMLADGHVCSREFEALERAQAQLANGLSRPELQTLLQELCEDLMLSRHLGAMGGVHLDADTLAGPMNEVRDPALRRAVVRAWVSSIDADEHRADAESEVLRAAERCWGIGRSLL